MTGDPMSAILIYLREHPNGATVKELSDATGFSGTAVRNNLNVMESRRTGPPWVRMGVMPGTKGRIFSLTDVGRRVAGFRADTRERRTNA